MKSTSSTRIEILKQYIAEDPSNVFSHYALALEYIKEKNPDDAKALLEGIILKSPDYLAAYYQLGKLFEQINSKAEAKKIYEAGIEVARQQKDFKTLNELQAALDSMED